MIGATTVRESHGFARRYACSTPAQQGLFCERLEKDHAQTESAPSVLEIPAQLVQDEGVQSLC